MFAGSDVIAMVNGLLGKAAAAVGLGGSAGGGKASAAYAGAYSPSRDALLLAAYDEVVQAEKSSYSSKTNDEPAPPAWPTGLQTEGRIEVRR